MISRTSKVEFPAGNSPAHAFQVLSQNPVETPWLFVFHEFLGLTEYIRQEAVEWQQELSVNVLALDLYDGKVGASREEGRALVTGVDPSRLSEIIIGALDYIGRDRPVSMLGWCFGGAWALRASILAGPQSRSTVMYYGMPVFETEELQNLSGPVVEIFGSEDAHINAEIKERFTQAMHRAGRTLTTYTYDAGHAFANPNSATYNLDATAEANTIARAFLQNTLLS